MWNKWQLFHATDFQSLMFPCFTVCRIFGIFPYKINISIFEASKPHYILLIVVTCVSSLFQLIRIYITLSKRNIILKISHKIWNSSYFLFETFISIIWFIMTKPQMRLLQMILEVSTKLSAKSYKKLSKLIHFKDIFGFFLMTGLILTSLHRHCYLTEDKIFCLIFHILDYYTNFQTFQMNMLYIDCVCILKACFKKIDDNLTNLRELIINNKSYPVGMIYCQQRNLLVLNEIKVLQKEYTMVSNVVQMLNLIFSPQLLVIFAEAFIEITFNLYVNIVQWNDGISIDMTQQIYDVVLTSYILYHVIKVTLIVWACETGKNQATKINTTLHDIFNSTSDKQIRNELRLFSLQILHRDNTFTTKGFTIDATFLSKIIGTITTYFLILIQFLIALHSCDKNVNNIMESN